VLGCRTAYPRSLWASSPVRKSHDSPCPVADPGAAPPFSRGSWGGGSGMTLTTVTNLIQIPRINCVPDSTVPDASNSFCNASLRHGPHDQSDGDANVGRDLFCEPPRLWR